MKREISVKELETDGYTLDKTKIDPYAAKLFAEIFTGMQGRFTRLKILKALVDEPSNVNQLAQKLGRDYKTIQRNVKLLEEKQIIQKTGEYGGIYFVTDFLLKNLGALDHTLHKVDRRLAKKKSYIT